MSGGQVGSPPPSSEQVGRSAFVDDADGLHRVARSATTPVVSVSPSRWARAGAATPRVEPAMASAAKNFASFDMGICGP